jgi:hypothetical protein
MLADNHQKLAEFFCSLANALLQPPPALSVRFEDIRAAVRIVTRV